MLKIYLKLLQKYRPSAGWTLAELMIAASMTLMVVMASGFGLIMILKENKVANGQLGQTMLRLFQPFLRNILAKPPSLFSKLMGFMNEWFTM